VSVYVYIKDALGGKLSAHVHKLFGGRSDHAGLLVQTERFLQFNPEFHPFLNDTFGTAMNQNIGFTGTPEKIHNGGSSTEWTGTAIAGTWNFADGGTVSLTSANNNDEAEFAEETPTTVDMSGFTTLTGKINLTIYNPVNNNLIVEFDNAGVVVGNSVDLNDFIDTGLIGTEQSFVIPKASLGLTTQLIDGFSILLQRTGGTKPTMKFDDIQLEETGDSAIFKATTDAGSNFHITEIRIALSDNIASTLSNGTLLGLDHSTLLGVAALANGIIFSRVQKGKTLFSVRLTSLGSFLSTGSNIVNATALNTKTFVTLLVEFPEPIILEGGTDDFLAFTINDNLSTLTQFTAAARGAVEIPISV